MSYLDLEEQFRERVAHDNREFGIDSLFLPNPVFSGSPKYALVCMEPSMVGKSRDEFSRLIDEGYVNFIHGAVPLILQFCAYKFLCEGKFDYHITDISKGSMSTSLAGANRPRRYQAWTELLRTELEFFGNPRLFTLGRQVESHLSKGGLECEYLLHYSTQNSKEFKDYLSAAPDDIPRDVHEDLRKFAEEVSRRVGKNAALSSRFLDKMFREPLPDYQLGMIAYYRDKFVKAR